MVENSMIHVPKTADEFRPPKVTDLITEGAAFLRAHWDEVSPYFQMISGETPSKHGSLDLDEAECAFKIKAIAETNGFSVLNTVTTAKMWKALCHAYKRNTGHTVRELETQQRRLAIEQRREQR